MNRDDDLQLHIGLGIVGVVLVLVGALVFYGTIAAVAIHFIHKLW